VCHLGFDWKYFLTICWPLWTRTHQLVKIQQNWTMRIKFSRIYPTGCTIFAWKMDILRGIGGCRVYKLLFTWFIYHVSGLWTYSKTLLTYTSWDRWKTSVLTKVRVIGKLKKNQSQKSRFCHIEFIICFDRPQAAATAACFCPLQFYW